MSRIRCRRPIPIPPMRPRVARRHGQVSAQAGLMVYPYYAWTTYRYGCRNRQLCASADDNNARKVGDRLRCRRYGPSLMGLVVSRLYKRVPIRGFIPREIRFLQGSGEETPGDR
jgi:hypothetical protein